MVRKCKFQKYRALVKKKEYVILILEGMEGRCKAFNYHANHCEAFIDGDRKVLEALMAASHLLGKGGPFSRNLAMSLAYGVAGMRLSLLWFPSQISRLMVAFLCQCPHPAYRGFVMCTICARSIYRWIPCKHHGSCYLTAIA